MRPHVLPPALHTIRSNHTTTRSTIESVLIPNGKASTSKNETSARRPCRSECVLSELETRHFAHCSFRWCTHRRGGLNMCRRAWLGNGVFYFRKATCATNWLPSRKLAKPTERSEKHCANVAHRKCCFPIWKRVVLNIGAPMPSTAEHVLPLAEKGACLHSGTGCAKAVFSEMSVFKLGK